MGCTHGHPIDPREAVIPGLYRCLSTVLVPMPVPTPLPHNELYYDDSPEAAETRRRVATLGQVADPIERLLRAAVFLEDEPGRAIYPALSVICPYLGFGPHTLYWEPLEAAGPPGAQAVPWDSVAVARWFVARAAAWAIPPGFQIVEGRLFQETCYGWRLIAGSTVRQPDGFTDSAFLLTTGQVVRAVAPEERRPGVITTRRTEPTGLNLIALAELGRMLGLPKSF